MSMAQTTISSIPRSSGETSRQTTSFDEYQSADHYKSKQTSRPSTLMQRNTSRPTQRNNEEFARASINSGSGSESEEDKEEQRKSIGRKYPEPFRGTG